MYTNESNFSHLNKKHNRGRKMIKLISHFNISIVAIFALISIFDLVQCKSIDRHLQNSAKGQMDQDPLQAVANEEYQYYAPEQPKVHYQQIVPTSMIQAAHQYETVSSGQQQQVVYEVSPQQEYYVPSQPEPIAYEPDEQQVHDQQISGYMYPQDQQQHQQQYQSSDAESKPHEYPGEILYVDKNIDGERDVSGSQLQQESPELTSLGNSIAKNSGLPATILTEVPVKDMPLDVLEKLKKDYGVKVVATREHPGANLVINCEHQPNHPSALCADQRQTSYLRQLPPYSLEQPTQEVNQPIYVPVDNQSSGANFEGKQNEGLGADAQSSGYGSSERESPDRDSRGEYHSAGRSEENVENIPNLEHNDQRTESGESSYGNRNPVITEERESEQESNTHEKQENLPTSQNESKSANGRDEVQQKEDES